MSFIKRKTIEIPTNEFYYRKSNLMITDNERNENSENEEEEEPVEHITFRKLGNSKLKELFNCYEREKKKKNEEEQINYQIEFPIEKHVLEDPLVYHKPYCCSNKDDTFLSTNSTDSLDRIRNRIAEKRQDAREKKENPNFVEKQEDDMNIKKEILLFEKLQNNLFEDDKLIVNYEETTKAQSETVTTIDATIDYVNQDNLPLDKLSIEEEDKTQNADDELPKFVNNVKTEDLGKTSKETINSTKSTETKGEKQTLLRKYVEQLKKQNERKSKKDKKASIDEKLKEKFQQVVEVKKKKSEWIASVPRDPFNIFQTLKANLKTELVKERKKETRKKSKEIVTTIIEKKEIKEEVKREEISVQTDTPIIDSIVVPDKIVLRETSIQTEVEDNNNENNHEEVLINAEATLKQFLWNKERSTHPQLFSHVQQPQPFVEARLSPDELAQKLLDSLSVYEKMYETEIRMNNLLKPNAIL